MATSKRVRSLEENDLESICIVRETTKGDERTLVGEEGWWTVRKPLKGSDVMKVMTKRQKKGTVKVESKHQWEALGKEEDEK